ncbi:MAG TPA: zf-HC2 domain-containing protein [Ignavibacteriaceae bacterium]|nr:zf-HC2 domain-containing protein [Ignavibacteriaceae bacterium]
MECSKIQSFIDGYYDSELDLTKSLEIEEHLKSCENCSAVINNYKILHNAFSDNSFYYNAPLSLKNKIVSELDRQTNKPIFKIKSIFNWRNTSFALTALLIISVILIINLYNNPISGDISEQIVNSHLRSLASGNPTDVLSTDKHTVKPWFNGKINFSPPVNDLTSQGFSLIGGRIDYLNLKPAAVLVYRYNKHIINLYISLSDNSIIENREISSRSGYNIIHWVKDGMDYSAISDLNIEKLKIFNEEFLKAL